MEDNTNTQQTVEANPNGANQTTPQTNEGNTNTQPQVTNEGKTYSQKEYDDVAAKARGTAERETKKKLLAQLGLTLEDEDKLNAFKEAYEASLSDEERKNVELSNLQAEKIKLSQDLEEKDYIIKALIALTGKNEEDVSKIVKMAKGLKTDENTIEDAINEVISMVKPVESVTTPATQVVEVNPNMPSGQPLQQPSTVSIDVENNPFKKGASFNLTKQGQLIRTNPELARKLANEAGVRLSI